MNHPPCPCGGKSYATCCEPFHQGLELAPTPEKLMRSRYSAYAMTLEPYLLSTWDNDTRPDEPLFQGQDPTQWVGLNIKKQTMADDQLSGTVEFLAIFKVNGKAHRIHEISQFIKQGQQWVYVDGQFPDKNKRMNEEEILHKMRAVFQDCQKQALALTQHHPNLHKGFVADMQFASTYGAFLGEIKINHGVDLEKDSIAQKLVDALAKTDSHAIGLLREEMYAALDQMQPEHYASYIFLTCFPSIYKAMGEK